MTILFGASITGAAVTGLTTPGYTLSADKAPDVNQNQALVTALTGTQTGVRSHSVSDPFIVNSGKPKVVRALPAPKVIGGTTSYGQVPYNRYWFQTIKGANYASNQAPLKNYVRTYMDIAAGADSFDSINLAAMISAHAGYVNANANEFFNTAKTGSI